MVSKRITLKYFTEDEFEHIPTLYCLNCGTKGSIWVALYNEGDPNQIHGCVECFETWFIKELDQGPDMQAIKLLLDKIK